MNEGRGKYEGGRELMGMALVADHASVASFLLSVVRSLLLCIRCCSFIVVHSLLSIVCLFCVRGVWHHSFGQGYRDSASRELPLDGQWWSRQVSGEGGDRG